MAEGENPEQCPYCGEEHTIIAVVMGRDDYWECKCGRYFRRV